MAICPYAIHKFTSTKASHTIIYEYIQTYTYVFPATIKDYKMVMVDKVLLSFHCGELKGRKVSETQALLKRNNSSFSVTTRRRRPIIRETI